MVNSLTLTKAQNAVTAHDWDTAARLYKELLRKDESNIEFLKELGNIYVKANADEKAIPYYEQIITFHPDATDAMLSLGAIYRRLKRYEDSIQILQRALDEGHNQASVNYTLGFTYKEMGNYEDAIDAFESVISVNHDDVLAYNHLGSIYYAQKDYNKSISTFTRGLQVDPNHPILNYNLARCYEAAKNYPEAVRCYENALKTRPGWADAIRDFSELLIKCQFTKQAQNLVEQSINLHPNDVNLLCILGRIYLNQFDYDNATKTFTKAKNLKNDDVIILMGLSEALEKNDKISQALETAIEAMDISPENKDVRKRYVHTLLSSQRYAKALEVLKCLDEETDGQDLQVMDLYGQYFVCRGDEEAANTYYDKIRQKNHHYKDYMLNAADRYIQTGNFERAESYANDFIESRPQLPDGYNRLGTVYRTKGELDTALKEFERSLDLKKPNVFADKEIARINSLIKKQSELAVEDVTEEQIPEEPVEKVDELNDYLEDIVVPPLAQSDEEEFDYSQVGYMVPELEEEEPDFWENVDGMRNDVNPLIDEESDTESILSMMDPKDMEPNDDEDEFDINPADEEATEDAVEGEPVAGEPVAGEPVADEGAAGEAVADHSGVTADELSQKMLDTADSALSTANMAQQMAQDVIDSQRQFEESLREENDKLIQEAVEKAIQEKLGDIVIPEDDFELDLGEASEAVEVTEEEPVEVAADAEPAEEVSKEVIEEEPAEVVAEDDFELDLGEDTEPAEITEEAPAEEEPVIPAVNDPAAMLDKIGKILNDNDLAAEYEDELELFKTLRVLSNFLPEGEKYSFNSCRMRMKIEYIISKLSGKPGLLETAESLIKSGVLGDEYNSHLEYDKEDSEVTNEMIRTVILTMKKLSEYLEDENLTKALSVSADGILEQIELENQKSAIF